MPAKSVKRVWEVCEPHPDVFARDPDPSLFAISLHHVEQGTADKDYTDPERFFSRTFMTKALSDLLERVVGRLTGQARGTPVLRLETPFGGGKTHTMTALYHIARHPDAVSEHEAIKPILMNLGLKALPQGIHVAVLDGRSLDVRERRVDGLNIRTIWGELAYRLGGKDGYEMVSAADETRTTPGGKLLTELLSRFKPALILMDEILEYLLKARAVKVGDSNLMEQTGAFLGELTSAVSAVAESVLVVSLPASSLEVPAENQEAAERLFQYAKKVFGRVELVETPVAQDEVFGVLRKRLFKNLGSERDQKRAVEAMQDYYNEYARFFPDRLRSPDYKERMLKAYPFHPELIDLLYERWGPHPQFQRTRGALRLLALVLRRIWGHRPGSAFLIQPCHVDFNDRHIRNEVTKLMDSGMDAVVTGDILQRAKEIERQLGGDYSKESLGQGAATCAFLYSISAATRDVGATEEEIRTALLRPEINPAMVSEVLGRLREGLWFLRYRDRRYFFTAKPNLNKVILDYEAEVSDEQVEKTLQDWLSKLAGKGEGVFQIVIAPEEPSSVPDQAKPTLVLLPLDVDDQQDWMQKALESSASGIRTNKNMLTFLVPDRSHVASLRAAAKRWQALKDLERSPSFKEMEKDDREQVQSQLKQKETDLEAFIKRTYQDIYRPSSSGLTKILVRNPEAIKAKTLGEYVKIALEQEGILIDRIAPEYIKEIAQIEEGKEVSLSQVATIFTGTPGQPLLRDPHQAIEEAVKEGVRKGDFGVKVNNEILVGEEVSEELMKGTVTIVPPTTAKPPQKPPTKKPLKLRVRTSPSLLYPLLQAAEILRELKNAIVTLEVDDPTGELEESREKIERLLSDYGCSYDWLEGQNPREGGD